MTTLYVIGTVFGMVSSAWIATKVIDAKHARQEEFANLHRRIDEVERTRDEQTTLLERNLTELIGSVQQELIRENASILNKINNKK